MKRKIISLYLALTMLFSMVLYATPRTYATTIDNMSAYDIWNMGFNVYTAWANNVYDNKIEEYYHSSLYKELYDYVFPDGSQEQIEKAYKYLNDAYNFVDETKDLEYFQYLGILHNIFWYQPENGETAMEKYANAFGTSETVYEIVTHDLIEEFCNGYYSVYDDKTGLTKAFECMRNEVDLKTFDVGFLRGVSREMFYTGDKVLKLLFNNIDEISSWDILKLGAQSFINVINFKNAAINANKYMDVACLYTGFDTILLQQTKAADKKYAEAATSLYGSYSMGDMSDIRDQYTNTEWYKCLYGTLDSGVSAISTDIVLGLESMLTYAKFHAAKHLIESGIVTGAEAYALLLTPYIAAGIEAIALGVILYNLMESTYKITSNALYGKEQRYTTYVNMDSMGYARTTIYSTYKKCLDDFKNNPCEYTADKLNSCSMVMWNLLCAENNLAYAAEETLVTAGLFNTAKRSDPQGYKEFLERVSIRGGVLETRRTNYWDDSAKLYNKYLDDNTHKLNFDANGGEFIGLYILDINEKDRYITKVNGHSVNIPNAVPVKENYDFMGWSDKKDATVPDPAYAPGNQYSRDEDLTLYAVWAEVPTIRYIANGTYVKNIPSSNPLNKDGLTKISDVVPTRNGYRFQGWSEDKDDTEPTYPKGQENLINRYENVILYAIWKPVKFNVTFNANGGVFISDNSEIKIKKKDYGELIQFAELKDDLYRDGYIFSGKWNDNKDGTGYGPYEDETKSIGDDSEKDREVFAIWNKDKIKVIYDLRHCDIDREEIVKLDNGKLDYTLKSPTQESIDYYASQGKKFINWTYYFPSNSETNEVIINSGENLQLPEEITRMDNNVIVYANWEDIYANAGNPHLTVISDRSSYDPRVNDEVKLIITASNSTYSFIDLTNAEGFKIRTTSDGLVNNTVLYEGLDYLNDKNFEIIIDIPDGCQDGDYTFNITASNGIYGSEAESEQTISDTITIRVSSYKETEKAVLTYDIYGGKGTTPETVTADIGSYVYADNGDGFYRDGYEFTGWSKKIVEKADQQTIDYEPGDKFKLNENTTLYAVWSPLHTDEDKELELHVGFEKTRTVYEPGEELYIKVLAINSDHFYVDVSKLPDFSMYRMDKTWGVNGTFFAEGSESTNDPAFDVSWDNYENGKNEYIRIKIPQNCKDGVYPVVVTGSSGALDFTNWTSPGAKVTQIININVSGDNDIEHIYLNHDYLELHIGTSKFLKFATDPSFMEDIVKKNIEWDSSKSRVASVSSKGEITAKSVGTAFITGTYKDHEATCEVNVVEHEYGRIISDKYLKAAATCVEQAEYYYSDCSCGAKSDKTFRAGELAGHSYSNWTIITEADEENAGLKQRECTVCHHIEEEVIPPKGHTHQVIDKFYSDNIGHWHPCEKCTERFEYAEHIFENSQDTTCDICGFTRKVDHSHTFESEWVKNSSSHWHECDCGERSEEEPHNFGNWIISSDPTETEKGSKLRICNVCKYVEYADIPATGSSELEYSDPTWDWKGYESATATFVSTDGSDTKVINAEITSKVTTEPTTEKEGEKTYTATVSFNGQTYTDKKTEILPKEETEYIYGDPSWMWNGFESAIAKFVSTDGTRIKTVDAEIASKVTIEPTTKTEGERTYTATVTFNGKTYTDTKTEVIPKLTEEPVTNYGEPKWDITDPANVTAVFTSKDDPTKTITYDADVEYSIVKPTSFSAGRIIYTATVTGPDGQTYEKTWFEIIPATGTDSYPFTPATIPPIVVLNPDFPAWRKNTDDTAKNPAEPTKPTLPFNDVDLTDTFYDEVKYVYDNDIMNGVSTTEFNPYGTLTRGMIVTILYRLEGEPTVAYSGAFIDVPAGEWYTDGVEWAALTGIVNGYGNGKYGPTDPITRQQLAAILYRYASYKEFSTTIDEDTNFLSYNDVFDIAEYAKLPMFWSIENGVITDTNGDLNPATPALRWEIAAAIKAFCENVAK